MKPLRNTPDRPSLFYVIWEPLDECVAEKSEANFFPFDSLAVGGDELIECRFTQLDGV